MPIGWGGVNLARIAAGAVVDAGEDLIDRGREMTWRWIEVVTEQVTPVVFTRWVTVADERVCPHCGPLDGLVWEAGTGPEPPLHVNCRCERVYAWTEWRVRG